jgi:lipid II:glycine glycyltransferase (peptidoglycan interpeptide bridge formation enzyme)
MKINECTYKYQLVESNKTKDGLLSFWYSPGNSDATWDEFLMKTPMGQFQQSSMWAQVKEVEGWESLRLVAAIEDRIVGGFQILWRNTQFGRIGYASKGPVAAPETQSLVERLVGLMCNQARKNNILALICQPPDDSQITSDVLAQHRFIQSNPMGVIETTLLVDVSQGPDAIEHGMSKKDTIRKVRIAEKSAVTIREATEKDIGLFFNLMSATCSRQGVKPNPPTETVLRQLWLTFAKHKCLRVTFAEYNQELLAGFLNILFGKKVNLWKKGWNFKYSDCYPNDLLYYETLHWACSNNYNNCDVIALDRSIADVLQNGKPLSKDQKKSPNIFHLRFGGIPKILPSARIWIANPFLRIGYEKILVRSGLLSVLKPLLS